MVWPRGEEGPSYECRLHLKRERPSAALPSAADHLLMRSWAIGKRRSAACDSTLIGMLRHGAHHVDPEISGVLRSAASRIEDHLSRKLKQRFKIIEMHMRAILDEYDTSQHQVVEALQGLLLNALDDDDIFEDIKKCLSRYNIFITN
jgi:hypothetical protein